MRQVRCSQVMATRDSYQDVPSQVPQARRVCPDTKIEVETNNPDQECRTLADKTHSCTKAT